MKNTDFTEQWTAMQKMFLPATEQWTVMQKMFLPTSAISAPLRENAQRFWENQEKVLDSLQALANGWFERRHTGTHKAREATERMCETQTFVDLIQAYQDWVGGAFERITRAHQPPRSGVPAIRVQAPSPWCNDGARARSAAS